MKKIIILFLSVFFQVANADFVKCVDNRGYIRYFSNDDSLSINQQIIDGWSCEKTDKRTPEQKRFDEKAYEQRMQIQRELAETAYQESVRNYAKFLNDVEKERRKNK